MPSPISAPIARSWQRSDAIPIQPGVTYDSIIPLIHEKIPMDGVVEYRSSHLDGARSERIVAGTHFSQQDPQVTAELDRILQEHLAASGGIRCDGKTMSARHDAAQIIACPEGARTPRHHPRHLR